MDVEQAVARLRELIDAHDGTLSGDVAETDKELAGDPKSAAAAAQLLANEPEYVANDETDGHDWFPYESIRRIEVPEAD